MSRYSRSSENSFRSRFLSSSRRDFSSSDMALRSSSRRSDYESALIPFTQTAYYNKEMGQPIARRILSFSRPLALDGLPEIKLATNALENERARDGRRLFNLDPGYITLERLVLATGKNFSHRASKIEERRVGKECRSRWSPYH